ncbi:ParA family protein [Bacillus thuringiensis]|nr:ParA family protein [Bacillus thuringiensis]
MDTKVISILNMKGGVGKSTITMNLAHTLTSIHNKRVLVIDFDPQANASSGLLNFDDYEEHRKNKLVISDIFTDIRKIVGPVAGQSKEKKDLISLEDMVCRVKTYPTGAFLDLVPSELELSSVLERTGGSNIEDRLKIILREKKRKYDIILVDCSPTYSVLTNNALKASDFVLIPVKPDPFSARGIPMLLEKVSLHNNANSVEDRVEPLGIIFTMVDDNIRYVTSVKAEILREHRNVFRSEILFTEHYSKGLFDNKSILETNATQRFKKNFKDFTDEFLSKLEAAVSV